MARVRAHDFAGAVEVLEPEVEAHPRDLKALNLLGIALTGAGRIEDANRRFLAALALEPGFLPAIKNLAVNEFTQGRLDSAQKRFERVLADQPADPIVHLHLGEIAHQRRDHALAAAHYQKSGDAVAGDPRWTLHYAETLLALSRREDALAVLQRLPEGDAEALFQAGVLLGQAEAHLEAARFFERAAPGYRDPDAAVYNQVLMLVRAGDHAAAIRAGEALLARRPPTKGELPNLMAQAYAGAGRIADAYESLRRATRLEPQAEENYLDLASLCLEHQNLELGLEIVDIGLRQRPESARLQLQRGALLAMKGQLDQAEAAFEAASRLGGQGSLPQIAMAMAWMQNGQIPRAVAMLRERARGEARDPLVFYILGLALMRSGAEPGDPAETEAEAAFQAALRLRPDHAPSRAELGKLLVRRGDARGAIAQLEPAVAREPDNVAAAYALAQAYRRNGQAERAEEMMARVSRLNEAARQPGGGDELQRTVIRILREGTAAAPATPPR
ncbi:MAG TPA: tetratricopeptide repeat protein [Vicinamibacteria bacterium]